MSAVRYTAAKRREVEAARAQWLEDKHRAQAAMSLEDYTAQLLEEGPPAKWCQDEIREGAADRHAALVARFA